MNGKGAFRTATAIGLTFALIAGCAPAPEPPPPPPPTAPAPPPPPPPPPVETDWRDREFSPGDWSYRQDNRGSVALFGPVSGDASFLVRCDMPARRIVFQRAGSIDGGSGVMAFQATQGRQSYPATNVEGAAYAGAATQASDPFLDMIAFSRGRIAVSVTGQPMLIVPTWAEMIRVFEDCRR